MRDLIHLFRWQDALDILILTFVFYRLYLWLKKKRALRMILAILSLPVYYLMAKWVNLPLSVWGLQNLWPVILLVLVVIFQQEIREVLGSISLPAFFSGKPAQPLNRRVEPIAAASFAMAQRGIGGLIVLQKGNDLDEFIHGESLLNAEITEDLLISIFNPASPLHDGAVIVRGDRIRYATALLPVSQAKNLPKEWGTRHRAGVGITEISDAESIIISEERRNVLFVSVGNAKREERMEDLKKDLSSLSAPEDREEKKTWRGGLVKDLPVKALSLFLVCVLWVLVIGIHQGEITYTVPVEYYSIPRNLSMSGQSSRISIRVKGSERLLSSLNPEELRARIDLADARPGANPIALSETDINVPSGISIIQLFPRKITVYLSPNSGCAEKP